MATTDNNIKYDLLFLDKFYKYAYPIGTPDHKEFYIETLKNGEIQISTFMENAIAKTIGIDRDSKQGQDIIDGSEVKMAVSSCRNNDIINGNWMHTYEVKNVSTKTGPIRFVGYNKIIKDFEYYFIPYTAYCHLKNVMTLTIETFSNQKYAPTFTGKRIGKSKWHQYQFPTFESMCDMKGPVTVPLSTSSQDQRFLF